MLKNYLKVALRNLRQNKSFSGLNILGLSLGMACSLLIFLWVRDEKSVDAFHANRDRLYAIYHRSFSPQGVDADYDNPAPLGDELKKTIPEVQQAATFELGDAFTLRTEDKTTRAKGGYAGEDFFTMFSFPFLHGNAATALKDLPDIAISKTLAGKLFGSPEAAMGKTLHRDLGTQWKNFVVSAVFDDVPQNSSLQLEFVMSWAEYFDENPAWKRWDNSSPLTVMMIRPGADPDRVAAKIKTLLIRHDMQPTPGYHRELYMQRFDEKYLHSNFKAGYLDGGRIEYVRLFSILAIFILVIACINFMNLTTARSLRRAKEVGVRKVIGARKGSLIRQFLGEAILLAALAMLVTLVVVFLLLPVFNRITDKDILLPVANPFFWLQLAGLTLLTGCLAGSYPALFLSSFRPIEVLKGVLRTGTGAVMFRKGLVVFQFTLSILLIIGTIVVTRQVNYIQSTNLGFDRKGLVYVPIEGELNKKYKLFKQQALQTPGIERVSYMSGQPTNMDNGTSSIEWPGKPANFRAYVVFAGIGYDFIKTVGAELLVGRDFSPDYPSDSIAFLLNEEAVRTMGFKKPADIVGQTISMWNLKGKVVGVIKNFHFTSLHDPIQPLILIAGEKDPWGNILVRVKPGRDHEAIASLQRLYRQLNPAFSFTYQFADLEYQKLYKSEQIIGTLSQYFAFLAIGISCLGLLGLAMFTAEQRTKEIGIRKILGAGTRTLYGLLARDFLVLVALAFLIAAPLSGWIMTRWLENYAYHTNLSAAIFFVAGGLAFSIALATISYHAIRAALVNPAKSLRAE